MDRAYFENYCGEGPYEELYQLYSGIDHCIRIVEHFRLRIRSVCVLGAATGQVVRDLRQAWHVRPYGCEISRWAHTQIPPRDRERIACADMRAYMQSCLRRRLHFDLIFSNSLVYLPANEIEPFLRGCRELGDYFHFLSSTSEAFEPGDRYRVTLRPRGWWRRRFLAAGFRSTRSPYLFQ